MNPLDNRYIGSVCEIKSFTNELLGVATIGEVGNDHIVLYAKDEKLREFNAFTKLKLNIFNSQAGFMVVICETLTSTKNWLKVVSPIRIVNQERRNGFRIAVDLQAKISASRQSLDSSSYEALQMVWVKDMSVCGLRIHASRKFITGQVVWLMMKLDDDIIVTKAQIMRSKDEIIGVVDGYDIREYGVKLIFEKEEDTDKLCGYIFKEQRKQSQKIK